jgi:hypothetical protein
LLWWHWSSQEQPGAVRSSKEAVVLFWWWFWVPGVEGGPCFLLNTSNRNTVSCIALQWNRMSCRRLSILDTFDPFRYELRKRIHLCHLQDKSYTPLFNATADVQYCHHCQQPLLRGRRKKCGGCRAMFYCNNLCQSLAWPEHKFFCQPDNELCFKPSKPLILTMLHVPCWQFASPHTRECCQCGATLLKPRRKCSCCGDAYYCNKICQEEHWPKHKHFCRLRGRPSTGDIATDDSGKEFQGGSRDLGGSRGSSDFPAIPGTHPEAASSSGGFPRSIPSKATAGTWRRRFPDRRLFWGVPLARCWSAPAACSADRLNPSPMASLLQPEAVTSIRVRP